MDGGGPDCKTGTDFRTAIVTPSAASANPTQPMGGMASPSGPQAISAGSSGRVWADGKQLDMSGVTMRVHRGTATQAPDSLIEGVEGTGNASAYPWRA